MDEKLKAKLSDKNIWLRLLFMVVFFIVSWLLRLVVVLVAIFQFLTVLITGERNSTLLDFSARLAEYIYQIVGFVTFTIDEKPFPFSAFPSGRMTNTNLSSTDNKSID